MRLRSHYLLEWVVGLFLVSRTCLCRVRPSLIACKKSFGRHLTPCKTPLVRCTDSDSDSESESESDCGCSSAKLVGPCMCYRHPLLRLPRIDATAIDAMRIDATGTDAMAIDVTVVDGTGIDGKGIDATEIDATANLICCRSRHLCCMEKHLCEASLRRHFVEAGLLHVKRLWCLLVACLWVLCRRVRQVQAFLSLQNVTQTESELVMNLGGACLHGVCVPEEASLLALCMRSVCLLHVYFPDAAVSVSYSARRRVQNAYYSDSESLFRTDGFRRVHLLEAAPMLVPVCVCVCYVCSFVCVCVYLCMSIC
jgi:hypothetical protein